MLKRCYDANCQYKYPTYIDCTVELTWHNFQIFARWVDDNGVENFELDKDLLIDGNKLYSENTCCFIPNSLNSFMANKHSNNKSGHVGVSWKRGTNKWLAKIKDIDTHKDIHLGYFEDIKLASKSYIKARQCMAERMRDRMIEKYNITDRRILDAIK